MKLLVTDICPYPTLINISIYQPYFSPYSHSTAVWGGAYTYKVVPDVLINCGQQRTEPLRALRRGGRYVVPFLRKTLFTRSRQ